MDLIDLIELCFYLISFIAVSLVVKKQNLVINHYRKLLIKDSEIIKSLLEDLVNNHKNNQQ